ncbi:MAG: DEAD/DEAH box helicase [Paludibacter sp.]|nr:DEAD/DEAH box helicase [Bacteroidales bacterium]MCM1068908.1 DEAD/DEAH box helicase [Prevotella sp.]MCM1353169.1 DEAD/DEAH box helicase [Bacteroides sp.]MCM1442491.1 DEAD/DEAH box helicase [Muribaculum sp.]MCM1481334.1 DEAD/DEAH box helicase [Paludibacter sp.]
MTFQDLGLCDALQRATDTLGFEEPTPVQSAAIPFMLHEERDLVALAQTGTGKTAAFGLPILQHIATLEDNTDSLTRALVLSPTRELCMQIAKDLRNYAQYMPQVRIVAVYGGEDIRKQLMQLDHTPQIIVATPGRLIDLLRRGKVSLENIHHLVLDEADEMLNMGFQEDIETILERTPADRRTMLFSATMPADIARIAKKYMHDAHEIQIGERNAGTENVEHIYYVCRAQERYLVLKRIVDLNPDIYAIVFCRTKAETQEIAEKLIKDGYSADALHGDLTQAARDGVMQRFRLHGVQILVATDVAARGLDVHNLTHVINYQLPDDPEVYTHRSGRTGRANAKGISVSIVHQRETRRIQNLERMLKREFKRTQIPSGMEVCKRQLFHQVSKLQTVDVSLLEEDTELLRDGVGEVMKMLDYLSKEDILKRFVALEFNRFLTYYKDAKDLNVEQPKARGERQGSRRENLEKAQKRGGRKVRLKINVGRNDGMNPKRFLGLINDVTHDRTIAIGDIEITGNYTFFDVYADQQQKVERAFSVYEDLFVQEAKGKRAQGSADAVSERPRFGGDKSRGRGKKEVGSSHRGEGKSSNKNNASDKPWRQRRR